MKTRAETFERLRTAIRGADATSDWHHEHKHPFLDLVRGSLCRWASDAERTANRAEAAVERGRAADPSEAAAEQLEIALMFCVAARDKIIALIAQLIGVPSFETYKKGIRFFPREREVRKALSVRARRGSTEARALHAALVSFNRLDAVRLRNQAAHSISMLPELSEITWVHVANVGFITGEVLPGTISHMYPEGVLDRPDITSGTIFAWVERSVSEATSAVTVLAEKLADFVTVTAEIAPPVAVYRIPMKDGIFTALPPLPPP